ncbi:MAG: nickel-responsive transcriptional regulator NikR [Pyrinomonadaceae bacterium]
MSGVIRFGISIEEDLLESYDYLIAERGYKNRSEAIRDLIRDALIQQKIENSSEIQVLGSLTIIYDHHASNLQAEMTELQHAFYQLILSVMHLHVNHDDCLEIIAVRGMASEIIELANGILSLKGIKNGKLFLTLPSSKITK